MRAIILAAGRGLRLGALTDDRPKCMIEFAGQPLLVRQLSVLRSSGINDITVVTGYRREQIDNLGVKTVFNAKWESSNMVASLMCAAGALDGGDDVLIAYSDILYEHRIIDEVLNSPAKIATVVDLGWEALWKRRMADPLQDAETMKLDGDGRITELGKKPRSLEDIEGQYVGLTKVSSSFTADFTDFYHRLSPTATYDGRSLPQMYFTTFLQHLIDAGVPLQASLVHHGWIEIDTMEDFQAYSQMERAGTLAPLYDPS